MEGKETVMVMEAGAPEERETIIICHSLAQVQEACEIAGKLGLQIWAAASSPMAVQFPEFKQAYWTERA